jgi:hypothetical protein
VGIIVIVASGLSTHFLGRRFQNVLKDRIEEEKEPSKKPEDIKNEQLSA